MQFLAKSHEIYNNMLEMAKGQYEKGKCFTTKMRWRLLFRADLKSFLPQRFTVWLIASPRPPKRFLVAFLVKPCVFVLTSVLTGSIADRDVNTAKNRLISFLVGAQP